MRTCEGETSSTCGFPVPMHPILIQCWCPTMSTRFQGTRCTWDFRETQSQDRFTSESHLQVSRTLTAGRDHVFPSNQTSLQTQREG